MTISNTKKSIFMLIMLILMIGFIFAMISPLPVSADVGNNNRYDSGDNGSSESSGSSFLIIFSLIYQILGQIGLGIAGIIFLIILFVMRKRGSDLLKSSLLQKGMVDPLDSAKLFRKEEDVVEEITKDDPHFSSEAIKQFASECFVTLQNAWMKREWEPVRHFESDTLFQMHNQQLQEYIDRNQINVIEKLNIKSTQIIEHKVQGDKEIVWIKLQAVMRDYVIDEFTEAVIEGNKNRDIHTNYHMEFIRSLGVKTKTEQGLSTTNCPNCGAPTTVTSTGKCSYCDSVITSGHYSWVLNELTTL